MPVETNIVTCYIIRAWINMIDRIECPRASIIATTTRDSNYADACLILKAGCSLEKWPRSSAWLSCRLIKCKQAGAHARRVNKVILRIAARREAAAEGRAAGRAMRRGAARSATSSEEEKGGSRWARTYNVSKRHLPLSSLLSSHRAVARKAARLKLADLIARRDQRTTYIVNCSHFRSAASPRFASSFHNRWVACACKRARITLRGEFRERAR